MRPVHHPIAMFVMAVLAVIGTGQLVATSQGLTESAR
jgi:hypothetical protein